MMIAAAHSQLMLRSAFNVAPDSVRQGNLSVSPGGIDTAILHLVALYDDSLQSFHINVRIV
ncbi:hypothetical protein FHW37_107271 [Neorhizobium alkalisoli]|uniref:Uncharacterized protein n=1 Tax=Neorhizobium alkalisoli TaxID=528178 RepID=A0A561QHN9_9HYPH|nr:hypothetical protein FHW37_107271 [Neorhizobium alkalisoli]